MDLKDSSSAYKNVEEMLTVEDACWHLLIVMQKLDIIRQGVILKSYEPSKFPPFREIVKGWYLLYMDMCEAGAFNND